jgi:hypothetical protein
MVLKRAAAQNYSESIHAVIVGADRVSGDWLPPLPSPSRDARMVADALTDTDGCAVPSEQVRCLCGPQATRHAVLLALQAAVARAGPEDSIYVYFAGHGISAEGAPADTNDFYLCTSNAQQAQLAETALSGSDIQEALGEASCRGVLILLDCCEGAAFAEHAPAMFRKLRRGDFRILLSSVRADQRSWERADGGGTLFSNALVDVLKGKVVVGSTPGAIYFSDLVTAIDKCVEEGLEALPRLPHQDMVFVGTYVRDPLILVHRALSLQQVQFATARYSPSYVRRVLLKALLVTGGLAFFALTTAYGVLNATQYAIDEGGSFVIYQGHPGYNLPGYPRRIWSLPYGAERLITDSGPSKGLQIVAPMGQAVYPLINERLRPDMRLLDLYSSGQNALARELAKKTIADASATFEIRRNAHLVFAMLAEPEDVALLRGWLVDERMEIRRAALRALMKIAPPIGFAAAEELVDFNSSEAHQDILKLLDGPCPAEVARYIENRFDTRFSHPTNTQIFDAAIRLRCPLQTQALLRSVDRPQLYGDTNAVNYAQLMGTQAALTTGLVNWLHNGKPDLLRTGTLIGTLGELSQAPCLPEYRTALTARMPHTRLMAATAIARHCPGAHLEFSWDTVTKSATVALLDQQERVAQLVFSISDDQARNALVLLTKLPDLQAPPESLRALTRSLLAADRDDYLRTQLINALVKLGDRTELPAALLDSNNLEVRQAVVEYRRAAGDAQVQQQLMDRIGGDDEFYVGLLGRMPLNGASTARLQTLLEGSLNERRQAACVLAMGTAKEVVLRLLRHSDTAIRAEAANCVSFNSQLVDIVAALPRVVDGFPIESYQSLQDQADKKNSLIQELKRTPVPLREWRLSLVDVTPGGFGRLGRGLRYWTEEQRFALRVQAAR